MTAASGLLRRKRLAKTIRRCETKGRGNPENQKISFTNNDLLLQSRHIAAYISVAHNTPRYCYTPFYIHGV
jgi:hypothetical protein